MKRKTFKTIHGFLTNMSNKAPRDKDAFYRRCIGELLAQIGITECIKPDEKPYEGITRMRVAETDAAKKKHLDAIARWFERNSWTVTASGSPSVVYRGKLYTEAEHLEAVEQGRQATLVGVSSSVTSVGITYRGRDFTQEQFEAIKKISREQGISTDQAIQIADGSPLAEVAP